MKVGQVVRIKLTGELLKVTRIDKHVYPICAGYRRFKLEEVE